MKKMPCRITYHVLADGNEFSADPAYEIVNFCSPDDPIRAENPPQGTLELKS